MWQKIKCWLGWHDWKKLPNNYDVTIDWECWKTIDFDDYNADNLFKCRRCGAVKR